VNQQRALTYESRFPKQGQARKLLNGGLPAGQEALKAATARPWVAFGSLVAACLAMLPALCWPWPLDGYAQTGIRRIEASRLAHEGLVPGGKQPPGALLSTAQVQLRLTDTELQHLLRPDPEFTREVVAILGDQADRYSLLLLDLTIADQPRYAAHRGDEKQNVGSVGKLLAGLGLLQSLADAWPDDIERRQAVLRDTVVTADPFSVSDHHTIRLFDVATQTLVRRPMQIGDQGTLYEQLDWTFSVSSNSAASMVMREAMLLRQLGRNYPMPDAAIASFFKDTPAGELTRLFQATFWEPVTRNGMDLNQIRQGSFFTAGGKKIVNGGGNSYATATALLQMMLLMEQGQLVDAWSSLELKRLLYVTERRIRYAASPALRNAAVYSKSGSWWGCKEEAGFDCQPYHGNLRNYMNSVSIIEEQTEGISLYYMVVLISNVLRENSAATHQTMATRIHQLIRQQHGLPAPE
jgi:hypothetical protein